MDMSSTDVLVRDEVKAIAPYNAGLTIDEVRSRYGADRISKLGSNENPLGPSPGVQAAIGRALGAVNIYPDPSGSDLRSAIARHLDVGADRIVLGNGSEDLLGVICRMVVRPGDTVVTLYPSFPLHEDYAVMMGGSVQRINLRDDLSIDVAGLVDAVAAGPRMVMFANPMNPAGAWLTKDEMQRVVAALRPGTLLVVDEAYVEYAAGGDYADAAELLRGIDGAWISLRTFSKAWGLAGLRIGYALLGSAALGTFLDRVRTPFNTNLLAQAAARAALDDPEHVARVVELAVAERDRVAAALDALGFRFVPSKGNFLFFDCGEPATAFCERLLRKGVIVKPWKQAGYETFVRVSIGAAEDNDRFLDAVSGS
jgi:histidinol-phosphate aminotransferase